MTDGIHEHPGRDHDLIERFVLHRLAPDERLAIEAHVKECASCRMAVETEREVVAGIRLTGRNELKSRLKQRLVESGRSRISWATVVSAAAVVGIITLVGIENNWFASRNQQPLVSTSVPQETAQPSTAAQTPDVATRTTSPDHRIAVSGGTQKSDVAIRKDEAVTAEKAAGRVPPALEVSPAPRAAYEKNRMEQIQSSSAIDRAETWVEGHVLDTGAFENSELRDVSRAKKIGPLDAMEEKGARLMLSKGSSALAITLSQEPFRALSIQQQKLQQQQRIRSIPTRVEQTTHGIHMTLYPESPIDSLALAQARIESIAGDSLIISFPRQRIGYRLPGGWQTIRK